MYKRDIKRLANRQTDTLIGISKAIIADGVVNQAEAEFLLNWLETSESRNVESELFDRLFEQLCKALEDGDLDDSEANGLLVFLSGIAGGRPQRGEAIKPRMPLDDPPPTVIFEDKQFMFTGRFTLYDRPVLESHVTAMAGHLAKSSYVSKNLDYLVIGNYASAQWKHETHGGKIEQAEKARKKRGKPSIISEHHFVRSATSLC